MRRHDAGFTLLEIIVAVVVLGFVLGGLAQASRFGINAWSVQGRESVRADELERTDRLLRQLMAQAAPPLAADDKPFLGREHNLEFITRLPDQPQTADVRRAKVAIGVDDRNRLVLRWQPFPNAVALKTLPPPEQIILAEGVDHMDMRYRQGTEDGGKWMGNWSDTSIPALVQINVVMQNKHNVWPVIQAATRLDPNGSF